jgi:hypothetical protein
VEEFLGSVFQADIHIEPNKNKPLNGSSHLPLAALHTAGLPFPHVQLVCSDLSSLFFLSWHLQLGDGPSGGGICRALPCFCRSLSAGSGDGRQGSTLGADGRRAGGVNGSRMKSRGEAQLYTAQLDPGIGPGIRVLQSQADRFGWSVASRGGGRGAADHARWRLATTRAASCPTSSFCVHAHHEAKLA